jgi:Subtilase family
VKNSIKFSAAVVALVAASAVIFPFATSGAAVRSAAAAPQRLTSPEIARLSQSVNQKVIIVLRNQHTNLFGRSQLASRATAINASQSPVRSELNLVRARNVRAFSFANMIAATVSKPEIAYLRHQSGVLGVVPDREIPLSAFSPATALGSGASASAAAIQNAEGNLVANPGSSACTDTTNPSTGQLEPEALQSMNAAFDNPNTPQAQSLVDGSGITVATFGGAVDPNIPDFQRNGQSVVTNVNFSGVPASAQHSADESFIDVSSIVAQGTSVFDAMQAATPGLNIYPHCYIRIRGVAPGAHVLAIDPGGTSFSNLVLGIQYAVQHGANILSESLGLSVYPDNGVNPWKIANDAATRDGVLVVVSSGDNGTQSTLSSPATDPNVLMAGATTTLRYYSQMGYPAFIPNWVSNGYGYISNQIASLSSAGISQDGTRTIDMVAPGDTNWDLCSTATISPGVPQYPNCVAANGQLLPFSTAGGTSESAPLLAGEAALVDQAYAEAHHGQLPSPLVVKQIMMGTATNLNLPSDEQGAGLGNALAAVKAAFAYRADGGGGSGKPALACPTAASAGTVCSSLVYSTGQANGGNALSAKGLPGTPEALGFNVTNDGTQSEVVRPTMQTLGTPTVTHYQLTYSASSPTVLNSGGATRVYEEQDFTVNPGTDHLTVAVAFPDQFNGDLIRLILFDPSWNIAGWSDPQGAFSYYGNDEVADPTPGTWHAIAYINPAAVADLGGRPVSLDEYQSRFVPTGIVGPSFVTLAPGASAHFVAFTLTPSQAGDQSDDIVLKGTSAGGSVSSVIPVTLRSVIPIDPNSGGSFNGVFTGGNGRGSFGNNAAAQVLTYEFAVPAGKHDLDVGLNIGDPGYILGGMLVRPDGVSVDNESNQLGTGSTMDFVQQAPMPGNWELIIFMNVVGSGNQTSEPFSGTIRFNQAFQDITSNLPNSSATKIAAGTTRSFTINVTNPTNQPDSFFADPRLAGQSQTIFPAGFLAASNTFVFPSIPTETTQLSIVGESANPDCSGLTGPTTPIDGDMFNINGGNVLGFAGDQLAPAYDGTPFVDSGTGLDADGISASNANGLSSGIWQAEFEPTPPYGASSTPPATCIFAGAQALTQAFDPNALTSTGDYWVDANVYAGSGLTATGYNGGLELASGASGQIQVTLAPPTGTSGVVRGVMYVDTMDLFSGGLYDQVTGQGHELIAIPYMYKVLGAT